MAEQQWTLVRVWSIHSSCCYGARLERLQVAAEDGVYTDHYVRSVSLCS